jgi:hypothetical protein
MKFAFLWVNLELLLNCLITVQAKSQYSFGNEIMFEHSRQLKPEDP